MNIDNLLKQADNYYQVCTGIVKTARIRKLPNGSYRVLSEKGKNLGTYKSKSGAEKRLRQVEYFKHLDKGSADDSVKKIDLTDIDDYSYSAILRKLRKSCDEQTVIEFLTIYKNYFDKAYKDKLQKPEVVALQNTLIKFHKIHPIKIDKQMIKSAAISELGNATAVGKYLSNIVKFILTRIAPEKRQAAIDNMKQKIFNLDEREISDKNMPSGSALGQSITFIKHVLFGHDAQYVRETLNSIVSNL